MTTATTAHKTGSLKLISDEQVAAYQRDGFIIIRKMFKVEELNRWKKIVADMLKADEAQGNENLGGVRVWLAGQMDHQLEACMCDPRITSILTRIVGPDVEFLSAKVVFKSAKTTFGTPWHQDWYYWGGSPKISVWLPLDAARPENGTLRVIPGTWKMPQLTNMRVNEGFKDRTPPEQLKDMPIVDVIVDPGDAVFFSDKCVHGSYPNSNGADRFAFIPTYRDASVKDDSLVWPSAKVLAGKSVNV